MLGHPALARERGLTAMTWNRSATTDGAIKVASEACVFGVTDGVSSFDFEHLFSGRIHDFI